MANKTNCTINGKPYYRLTKTVGHKINAAGNEVPVKKQFYGENKKAAELKFTEYMNRRDQGIDDKKQYFGIVADRWIYEFFIKDNRLKDRTKDLYISAWNNYIKPLNFYHLPLEQVSTSTIQNAYNNMDAPLSSIEAVNKLMRRFYKYLEREGLARNITGSLVLPKKDVSVNKDKNKITVWTDEEVERILNHFDQAQEGFRLRFLVILAYYTGCRISELLALKYEDFTEENISINKQVIEKPCFNRDGKTTYTLSIDALKTSSSYRLIPLNEEVKKELEIHKIWQKEDMLENGYRTEYLFTTNTGGFYYRRNVSHALERYYKRIQVTAKYFHTYRHTFGTNLCRKGIPIQVASSLLGHSDINITAKYYIDISMNEKKKAIEALTVEKVVKKSLN